MWVCRPNRVATKKITNYVFDVSLSLEFSAINELGFSIASKVEKRHELIDNPLIKAIRERYLIRVKIDGKIEYFVVYKINKSMDSDGNEFVRYTAFSLAVQLGGKLLKDEHYEHLNISAMSKEALLSTVWSLDYVDADFDLKYREMEVSSGNVLNTIFDIAQKFNAGIIFDTVQQKISYHKPDNIGKNYGLKLHQGKFLENFNLNIDPERIVTRLKVYGSEGLEFRSLSPTGSNYIEDYSFFMFPFECDDNYNVIKSSNFMSDALCIAMTKYQKLLKSIDGQFIDLVKQSAAKKDEIITAEQEKSKLDAKRNDLLNQRDVINYTYSINGEEATHKQDWIDVINQLTQVEAQIAEKERQIETLNGQLKTIMSSITALNERVKVENNFTKDELYEWNKDFIIEAEHFNDSITDEQDLLDEAYDVFDQYRMPPLELNISIDNFLANFENKFHKGKLNIGDIIFLRSKDLDIDVKAKIMRLDFNFESGSVNIQVSNTTRAFDDMDIYMDKLNISYNTSTTVNNDKWKWDQGKEGRDDFLDYINGVFDAAKQLIQGGINGSTTLSERGLMSRDLVDNRSFLMITNGQLLITPDNGNSVSVAINKDGVHAERLVGKLILGSKLEIIDAEGVVRIQSGQITIFDKQGKTKVQLGRYPDPDNANNIKYGLRIYDGAFDIRTSDNSNRGVQIDGNGIRTFNNNGVRTFNVDAATGMVEIIGSLSIRTSTSTNKGVVIDGDGIKGYNASGGMTFRISNSGDAWFAGRLEWATGNIDHVGGSFTGELVEVTGTLKAVNGIFSGKLSFVDGEFTGELIGATGRFDGLVAGTISAQTMTTIRLDANQIVTGGLKAERIDVNELSAISSNLGNIRSGNIDIDEDLYVGRNIYLGQRYGSDYKSVIFNNVSRIEANWNKISVSGSEVWLDGSYVTIRAYSTRFEGIVDFSSAQVIGLPR